MKYKMTHFIKDAAMWRKVNSTIGETTPESFIAFTSMMGFTKTNHGTYWKRTACDEGIEIAIVNE